ncbi:LIM and SH3 domain protein F42H10.3-like isoform X1 [Leptotrombidium deliense]|uniref:LIM and SH3 domain protein F42H10.3-like isoform X1 n=1 Tax=Leptotrombidium deliense TaxID=299467 RepID=A0A443SNF0_9ACAR|nr:LIM and SH3 domain protein F42H10.3-like isoform X1 [Leptotrombidium deliense]
MNKCARCEKTVYPIEELKCLDKVSLCSYLLIAAFACIFRSQIWHKGCFKCQECGMALNMKTYKGYNKMPYCSAHIPQVRHTAVADTPEARRLAENTRIQSNIKYHEDFEKSKGKVTQVADDPETVRIRNTSKIISNVTYHGEYEKKKQMEEKRSLVGDSNGIDNNQVADNKEASISQRNERQNKSFLSADKIRVGLNNAGDQNQNHDVQEKFRVPQQPPQQQQQYVAVAPAPMSNLGGSRKIGSIADYDPINDNYGSVASNFRTSDVGSFYPTTNTQSMSVSTPVQQQMLRGAPMTRTYRAMYDYTAQDIDEVSFQDGDLIVNCMSIDEGWMTGTIQRTGQTGMLPANYVELL